MFNAPGEKPPPVGWKRLSDNPEDLPPILRNEKWDDPESGFRAALYESEIDGSKVLAFRGTADKAGWANNFQQGLGYESEQYSDAIALALKTKDTYSGGLDITGHSLGGGLTSAASIITDTPGYTYNGSGVHPNTIKPFNKTRTDGDRLINAYHVKGEILTAVKTPALNAAYTPVGTSVRYAQGEKPLKLQPVKVYDTVGVQHELPVVDASGKTVSIRKPLSYLKSHTGARHGRDYLINGLEKQIADDQHAITQMLAKT